MPQPNSTHNPPLNGVVAQLDVNGFDDRVGDKDLPVFPENSKVLIETLRLGLIEFRTLLRHCLII